MRNPEPLRTVRLDPDLDMASTFASTDHTQEFVDRRAHSREKIGSVVYVDLSAGNGGIILNISEGGFAVQAAMALIEEELPSLRFRFSKSHDWIKESGIIAWKSESKKLVGVRFLNLSEESRSQINTWIASEASGKKATEVSHKPRVSEPPAIAATRTEAPIQDSAISAPAGKNQLFISRPPADTPAAPEIAKQSFTSDAPALAAAPSTEQTAVLPTPAGEPVGAAPIALPDVAISAPIPEIETVANASTPPGAPASPVIVPVQVSQEPRLNAPISRRAMGPRAQLKRFLVDERHRIRLYDLVSEEAEKLYRELTESNFPTNAPVTDQEFVRRVHRYEEVSEELVSMIIIGCFWAEKNQELLWAKVLQRIGNAAGRRHGIEPWVSLQSYPALLLLYAGGVAAIANEKYAALEALLSKPRFIGPDGDCRLMDGLAPSSVIPDERLGLLLSGGGAGPAPVSTYIFTFLRERLREFVPFDYAYDEIFDRFEYLLALVWIDESPVAAILDRVPLGRFAWKESSILQGGASVEGKMSAEVTQQGKDWPVFRAGMFGGSMQRFISARNRVALTIGSMYREK